MERVYASWRAMKGIPAELMDPDMEWVNPPDAIEPGTRRGPEGVSGALANFSAAYTVTSLEVERMIVEGDDVAASVKMTYVGRGSGIPVRSRQGHRFTLRGGKVRRFEWSNDPEGLLGQVGG